MPSSFQGSTGLAGMCPHAQPGCPTRGLPPAEQRIAAAPLTNLLESHLHPTDTLTRTPTLSGTQATWEPLHASAYDLEDEAAKKLLQAIQTATVRYATWSTLTVRPKKEGRPYPNETPDFKEGRALRDYQVRVH